MTVIPYEPPEREFTDTMLAFRDFDLASTWSVGIEPDPLGPVNKIVTLMRGRRRIKSVLAHVPVGATVRLVRDEGGYRIEDLFALHEANWRTGETIEVDFHPPGWRVEVNGRTVLAVTDAEMQPPRPPAPRVPLQRRMRQALCEQVRADADWIAGRLGYHRDEHCTGWDE